MCVCGGGGGGVVAEVKASTSTVPTFHKFIL